MRIVCWIGLYILFAASSFAHSIEMISYDEVTDSVIIDVQYSGGCREHQFSLDLRSTSKNSDSDAKYYFHLNHNLGSDDPCEKLLHQRLTFPMNEVVMRPSRVYVSTAKDGSHPFVLEI